MILDFSYDMRVSFSAPVTDHHYSLMCFPRDTCRQRIPRLSLTVAPDEERAEDVDCFGNRILHGLTIGPHDSFCVRLQGRAQTGLAPHEHRDTDGLDLFRVPSRFTQPGPAIRRLYAALNGEAPAAVYERVHWFMRALHDRLVYQPGATDIHTTAEQALEQGRGVCQDYAHIFLALLRLAGIPARYVVGMMEGEGQSHAWVEAHCKGYWYGFDPTNRLLVDDRYVKISHGRDYGDCIVTRGVFRGAAQQEQQVKVTVTQGSEA